MEKQIKSDTKPGNSKLTFLENIPSQLRYAYLALKKKLDAKPPKLRDRDKDLNDVIEGQSFGYLAFEKICKYRLEPEDCFLRFDAISCKLILNLTSSMELMEFHLFETCRPSPQFETANKKLKQIDNNLIFCVNVMADDSSGCKEVIPLHFVADDNDTVMKWRHALKATLAYSAKTASQSASDWGASFLWRVWRTVPAPEASLCDHLADELAASELEARDQTSPQSLEFSVQCSEPYGPALPENDGSTLLSAEVSPTGNIFDQVLYKDSRTKNESLSYFELLTSTHPQDIHRLQMLQKSGIVSELDMTLTTACAAELWDDAYGMGINPRTSPFDGIRADGNTALHFMCNQDQASAKCSLGIGSIYEKLLRVLLEKGGEQIINAANRQGITPLMMAVSRSNNVLVDLLVSLSADVFAEDAMGNTSFHYAVCFSTPDMFKILCSKMRRFRRASSYEALPQVMQSAKARSVKLRAAVFLGSLNQASKAVEEEPSNSTDLHSFAQAIVTLNSGGHSILHLAVARRDTDCFCKILDFLSELGLHSRLLCASDHRGETPLHYACRKGNIEEIIVLLFHGSRLGATSDGLLTAEGLLRQYISRKQQGGELLQLLFMLDQVIQKEDLAYEMYSEKKLSKDLSTSLAVSQVEFCQVLRKKRRLGIGMPSSVDVVRLMPSVLSCCPTLASSCDWIMKLVEAGDAESLIKKIDEIDETVASCIDMTDSNGNTMLHKAAEHGHFDIIMILLDAGIDAAKENLSGVTAVHVAVSKGFADVYFNILSSLLSFEFMFHSRENIMHLAASGGNLEILDSLHCLGGSVKDGFGNSNGALEAAMQNQQLKTSVYAACSLSFPSWSQLVLLEIKDFVLKLKECRSDWPTLMDSSAKSDNHSELRATIVDANGLMVAQSLTSDESSAIWRHLSDELWQSLSTWHSRDEYRHYLVHIAVINRKYEALNIMLLNGHSPTVLDGKFCNPLYYACSNGDWRLVAVLRCLYLVHFCLEDQGASDTYDDAFILESINNDDKYVLLTLLLLNVPLANHAREIVVSSERSCADLFPPSIMKAFHLKNAQIFHLLIKGCYLYSVQMRDESFQSIVLNMKTMFVSNSNFRPEMHNASILNGFMEAVGAISNSEVTTVSKKCVPEQGEDVLVGSVANLQSTASPHDYFPDHTGDLCSDQLVPSVDLLKTENGVAKNEVVFPNAEGSLQLNHVDSRLATPENCMPTTMHEEGSGALFTEKLYLQPCSDSPVERSDNPSASSPIQPCITPGMSTPTMDAVFGSPSACEASSLELSEDSIQDPNIRKVEDDLVEINVSDSRSDMFLTHSSPFTIPENDHYAVKETIIFAADAFELEVEKEYKHEETTAPFEVQDVLPVVQIDDHVGNSFLNACKLGANQVLASLTDAFSVDSIFSCPLIVQGNPMHLAVHSHSLSTVEMLLKWKPALVVDTDRDGCTALHAACRINFHAALSKFLNPSVGIAGKTNKIDHEGHSCLTLAVKMGSFECVELLAKTELDALKTPSTLIPSALELSLAGSFYMTGTFLHLFNLCSEQAIHQFRSSHDNGLLQVAVKYQRMHSVCAILQRMGENFAQIRDATGRTAAEMAAASGNKSMFNLFEHETRDLVKDYENRQLTSEVTKPTSAAYFGEAHHSNSNLLRSFPGGNRVASSLIDQISSVSLGTVGSGMLDLFKKMVFSGNAHLLGRQIFVLGPRNKCTCLHLAAGVNSAASLRFVLDNCSRSRNFIDLHNSDGMTACAVALVAGHSQCVKLLLQQGSRVITESLCGTSETSIYLKKCNLLHICAKYCHDSSLMEQLLDVSSSSNILSLDESNQSLLHICAHANNVHAFSAIAAKAPHVIGILINHRDELGNTALHICSSNSGSLRLARELVQSGCYTHLRNYDGDLPYDIASFMGNMDIAQLTRSLKIEENVNKSDFRLQCRDYAAKLEEAISHDQASDIPKMCKSPLWIGSWLSFDCMSSVIVAQKAADLRMASALSNAGFCALSCPLLVQKLLGIMLKNQSLTVMQSLDKMFAGCTYLSVSSFLVENFPEYVIQVAREKNSDASIIAWVVKYWTRLSVRDINGFNALQVACQTENVGFFEALVRHLEELTSKKELDINDRQILHCFKTEILKATLSRTASGLTFFDIVSGDSVTRLAMKLISLSSCKFLLRTDPPSKDSMFDPIPERHLTLVSFGMFEQLFLEADFAAPMAQQSRDSQGRCLVANACISGQVASVSALLEKGFSPSVTDFEGLGILNHAVLHHKNDIVYFIIKRFPQKVFDLDSNGSCLLHHAIRNGSDNECLGTLQFLQTTLDEGTFTQLCLHLDDSKCTAVEESILKGKYNSGLCMLQHVVMKSGHLSANPIHVYDSFVREHLVRTFGLVSEFNALLAKVYVAASTQNSLMSFLKVFCSDFQSPLENDDILQHQTFESASSSAKTMASDLKFSSFFSGQWVCLEETFVEHFLASNDTSSTKSSLAQLFSSVYNDSSFSNFVRPSVCEALMAHSLRLHWILQDGISPSDCDKILTIHSELIRKFFILESLSSIFYSTIQRFCNHEYQKLIQSDQSPQNDVSIIPTSCVKGNVKETIDYHKLNAIGIYPPMSSDSAEAAELFELISTSRIDDIISYMKKSTKHATLSLDHHKNTLAHAAAFLFSLTDVERLIQAGLQVGVRNDSGQMPFHFACLSGRFEVAELCFRSFKSDVLPSDSYGHSALHFAALSLDEYCVSCIQKNCLIPWDSTTSRLQTALEMVLEFEAHPSHPVCMLLARGEALTEAYRSKGVSMQFALQSSLITCCRLDSPSKAACCIYAGADIRNAFFVQGDNGEHNFWNAIDVCSGYNSVSAIRSIFNCVENEVWLQAINHLKCNRQQNQYPASLWVACKHRSQNLLKFLLDNGSNLMEEDENGLNVVAFCVNGRFNDSLLEILQYCSVKFDDLFLKKFILTKNKMGKCCVEYAIQAQNAESIRIIREILFERTSHTELEMILLGYKYMEVLCQSKCDLPQSPYSTLLCMLEVLQFLDKDVGQALVKSYGDDNNPMRLCIVAGGHDLAVLLFILHVLVGVNLDGHFIQDIQLDQQIGAMGPENGCTPLWNSFQAIEHALQECAGQNSSVQRYLSAHVGQFAATLDDRCRNSFMKLLLSRNQPVLKNLVSLEIFFSSASTAFNELRCYVKDAAKQAPFLAANFTADQNALLDAVYRGDLLDLNKIIIENPSVYLDPRRNHEFHNQCYVAAIHGDYEHMLEFLVQKGFQYSLQSGEENLLMLASRLGRSKMVRALSQRPCLKPNVNYITADGVCALHLVCVRNFSETFRSLVTNFPDIDVTAVNGHGESAVSLCVKHGHISILEAMIDCLGVPVFMSILNESKQNVFHLAAAAENPVVFQAVSAMILKALNQTHMFSGEPPASDQLKLIVELSRGRVQPDDSQRLVAALVAQDVKGDTPAHICISSRSVASLAMLIHLCPAVCLMPNAVGLSSLHLAVSRSFFSVGILRLLVCATKSLGQWIFDSESRMQLAEEHFSIQASLMASFCRFEDAAGATVWDIAFAENADAQLCITKFISACRTHNSQKVHITQLVESSFLKSLLCGTAAVPSKNIKRVRGPGSIFLASINFLQTILSRSKLNRWYAKQLDRKIYKAGLSLKSTVLLQRSWRCHVAAKKFKAAKFLKMCYISIQCCMRCLKSRRIFILRKNLHQQLDRLKWSLLIWSSYQRFIKHKFAVEQYRVSSRMESERRTRCSISGAIQLQAAIVSHHLHLMRKCHTKKHVRILTAKAAGTLQRIYRGREGRRLFSSLKQLSEHENCVILPGRKLYVYKFIILRSIRRIQSAVRFLLAKRKLSVQYVSKYGLKSCCLIQRVWLNHFSRMQIRRARTHREVLFLSAAATKIQTHFRSKLATAHIKTSLQTYCYTKYALTIQCAFRCRIALKLFRLRADAEASHAQRIRRVQDLRVFIENESLSVKRGKVENQLVTLKGKAATVVTSLVRGFLLRCRKVLSSKRLEQKSVANDQICGGAATTIQQMWLRHCSLQKMRSLGWSFGKNTKKIVAIQRIMLHLMMRKSRKIVFTQRRVTAVIRLQNMWRVYQSNKTCFKIRSCLLDIYHCSQATKIKSVFKAHRVRLSIVTLKSSWPELRELRISKKVLRQFFTSFQSSKFHKIVLKTIAAHKQASVLKIQCAFRTKVARNTFRSAVCLHNMNVIERKTRQLQKFWRRCSQAKRFCSKLPWMIFPWPSSENELVASSWSVSHTFDVRLEGFMQSKQFNDYDKSLSAACQFGMRQLQEVPEDAVFALQSLVRFAASMCETSLHHGNRHVAFSLASRACKLIGSEKNKFVLSCRTEFSAWVLDTLAHVMFSRGIFAHALSLVNEAIIAGGLRSSPDSNMLAVLHFHKGLIYQELGNSSSAKDSFFRSCHLFHQRIDNDYSMHLAAAHLALSNFMFISKTLDGAALNCSEAKRVLLRISASAVQGTFYPPAMCWRHIGLLRLLRRNATVSDRFIQSALLKFDRSKIEIKNRVFMRFGKSRIRRIFDRSHLFPMGIESWTSWSSWSFGPYGIIPERPNEFMIQKFQNRPRAEMIRTSAAVNDSVHKQDLVAFDSGNGVVYEPPVTQELIIENKLKNHFSEMNSCPALIHPWHLFNDLNSTRNAFQDIQYLLSSCLDVSASTSSQQRWLNHLQRCSPDEQLPSFVKALVTRAPTAHSVIDDSATSVSSVKVFSASPHPIPRKEIVACLNRAMLSLLQQACSFWRSCVDGQSFSVECKDSVQLLKDMINGNMNSLKHAIPKAWRNVIILCDAVLLALSSNFAEAFNCCMRVHDELQKAERLENLDCTILGMASNNAVYCLWHFQTSIRDDVISNTTTALSEMLSADVKLTARIEGVSPSLVVCMFHNLAHIAIQSGEYLRAFRAWGEAHKTLDKLSGGSDTSISEILQCLASNDTSLSESSRASIEGALSSWSSIKNLVSSSEHRISTGIQGIREIKQTHQRTPKKQRENFPDAGVQNQSNVSLSAVQQNLPEALLLGLFGPKANLVRTVASP